MRERHGLSRIEVVIVDLLHNHPGGIRREPDREDRRAAHLELTPAAPLAEELEAASREWISLAFESFSEEECALLREFPTRPKGNVSRNWEGRDFPLERSHFLVD